MRVVVRQGFYCTTTSLSTLTLLQGHMPKASLLKKYCLEEFTDLATAVRYPIHSIIFWCCPIAAFYTSYCHIDADMPRFIQTMLENLAYNFQFKDKIEAIHPGEQSTVRTCSCVHSRPTSIRANAGIEVGRCPPTAWAKDYHSVGSSSL